MKKTILLLTFTALIISCGTIQKKNTNEEMLWVNSAKVPCVGIAPMHCLEVQKGEKLETNKWQLFYSRIEDSQF